MPILETGGSPLSVGAVADGKYIKREGTTLVGTDPPGAGQIPVGFLCFTDNSANPAVALGYGTWVAVAAGRVIVGFDAGDPDFDTDEETGGAKTKAISAHSGAAVDAHPSHTHTYSQVPNHVHGLTTVLRTATTGGDTTQVAAAQDTSSTKDAVRKTDNPDGGVAQGTTDGPSASLSHAVTQPVAHSDLNVVQPYIVFRVWKRTA